MSVFLLGEIVSHRNFLWESLSEDEKNKVYVGSANPYSLQKSKNKQISQKTPQLPLLVVCHMGIVKFQLTCY